MIFDHAKRRRAHPALVALAIAVLGILAMLIVDHGPWSRRHAQTAEMATHQTTGEAARSAGAGVVPTEPKSRIEPEPAAPRQAEPPNPAPQQ
jgi:hypothetical protein